MSPDAKPHYRRLRNMLGLGLAVAWVVIWYLYLDAQYRAATAAIADCEALSGAKWLACKGGQGVDSGTSALAFAGNMFGVIVTSPFAFIVAHYLARTMVEQQEANAVRAEAVEAASRQRLLESQQAQRIAQSEAAARTARLAINRGEFIDKLGSVMHLLDLLPIERDAQRAALVRQNITQELIDLVAKHSLPDLEALVRSDETIQLMLTGVLTRLSEQELLGGEATKVMQTALLRGTSAMG